MALDLRQELMDNDANAFVDKVFGSPDATVQMANVHGAIEQARTSDSPDLQQFAVHLNTALTGYAQSEKYDIDAEIAQQESGWGGLLEEIMGPDGAFQMSDLQNLDFGKLLGHLFKNLFNNEAAVLNEQSNVEMQNANMAARSALAYLDRAEANGADVSGIRRVLGDDNSSLLDAKMQIDMVSPGAPPPPPPGVPR